MSCQLRNVQVSRRRSAGTVFGGRWRPCFSTPEHRSKRRQDLLRHSSLVMTLGTYAKAVTADKRNAQETVMNLFLPKTKE
jgi:integrase